MLKKVLCVVLALVLALGTMSVVGFAATADDLAAAVAKLPDDYNAQFYNDETVAAIKAAKAAAAAGTDINGAIALCNEAYALATAEDVDDWGGNYYVNRDESKAVVNYKVSADKTTVKPGETISVTVSYKSNFYVAAGSFALAYDCNALEFVSGTPSSALTCLDIMDSNPNSIKGLYGYVPMEWNYADADGKTADEKFNVITTKFTNNISKSTATTEVWYPSEMMDVITYTFKANENITEGTGKIFIDDTLRNSYFEYETDFDFYEAVFYVERGSGQYVLTQYDKMDGLKVEGCMGIDFQASYDQTYVYEAGNGAEVYTSTDVYGTSDVAVNGVAIDVEIASSKPANYDALNAAIAEAANYSKDAYTADSYKALEDALAAADELADDLTTEEQKLIDDATAAIYAAIKGLVRQQAAGCPITSVAPAGDVRLGQYANLNVVVEGSPVKLRFVDENAASSTIDRTAASVLDIVDNGDGTETWTVKFYAGALESVYTVYARFDEAWNEAGYVFDLVASNPDVLDDRFISYDIVDDVDGVVYEGVNTIIVKTGVDVTKVQFMKDGNTWTYGIDSTPTVYSDADGVRTWTCKLNLVTLGDNTFDIRTRTTKSSFVATGEKLDVLVYSK